MVEHIYQWGDLNEVVATYSHIPLHINLCNFVQPLRLTFLVVLPSNDVTLRLIDNLHLASDTCFLILLLQ